MLAKAASRRFTGDDGEVPTHLVPHDELGWACGRWLGEEQFTDKSACRQTRLQFELAGDQRRFKWLVGRYELQRIRRLFPTLASLRTVSQLKDVLPVVSKDANLAASSLALWHDLSTVSFARLVGISNPTPSRRTLARDALLQHIIRERVGQHVNTTFIGHRMVLRIAPLSGTVKQLPRLTSRVRVYGRVGSSPLDEEDSTARGLDSGRSPLSPGTSTNPWPSSDTRSSKWTNCICTQLYTEQDRQEDSAMRHLETALAHIWAQGHTSLNENAGVATSSTTLFAGKPHMCLVVSRALSTMFETRQPQTALFLGCDGSGKSFNCRLAIDFCLRVDEKLRQAVSGLRKDIANTNENNQPPTLDLPLRTKLDAALYVLEAFCCCAAEKGVRSSSKFVESIRLLYNSTTKQLTGAYVAPPVISVDYIHVPVEQAYNVLTWLYTDDAHAGRCLDALEEALTTLGVAPGELVNAITVLSCVMLLRNVDIRLRQPTDGKKLPGMERFSSVLPPTAAVGSAAVGEPAGGSDFARGESLLSPVSGGHWLIRAATRVYQPPTDGEVVGGKGAGLSVASGLLDPAETAGAAPFIGNRRRGSVFKLPSDISGELKGVTAAVPPLQKSVTRVVDDPASMWHGDVYKFVSEVQAIEQCARMLEIDPREFASALSTPDPTGCEEFRPAPGGPAAVRRKIARRATARFLYSRVVQWALEKINLALTPSFTVDNLDGSPLPPAPVPGEEYSRLYSSWLQEQRDLVSLTLIDPPGHHLSGSDTKLGTWNTLITNCLMDGIANVALQATGVGRLRNELRANELLEWADMFAEESPLPERVFGDTGVLTALRPFVEAADVTRPKQLGAMLAAALRAVGAATADSRTLAVVDEQKAAAANCLIFGLRHFSEQRRQYTTHRWVDYASAGPPLKALGLISDCRNEVLRSSLQRLHRELRQSHSSLADKLDFRPRSSSSGIKVMHPSEMFPSLVDRFRAQADKAVDNGPVLTHGPGLQMLLDRLERSVSFMRDSNTPVARDIDEDDFSGNSNWWFILSLRASTLPTPSPVIDGAFLYAQLIGSVAPSLLSLSWEGGSKKIAKFPEFIKTFGCIGGERFVVPTGGFTQEGWRNSAKSLAALINARHAIAPTDLAAGNESVFATGNAFAKLKRLRDIYSKTRDDLVREVSRTPPEILRPQLESALTEVVDAHKAASAAAEAAGESPQFLWPLPVFNDATTGAELMAKVEQLEQVVFQSNLLPHSFQPGNLESAQNALQRMQIEAEIMARAEFLLCQRFIRLVPIRDLCIKAVSHQIVHPLLSYLYHTYKEEEALHFPKNFTANSVARIRAFYKAQGWLPSAVDEESDTENERSVPTTSTGSGARSSSTLSAFRIPQVEGAYTNVRNSIVGLVELDDTSRPVGARASELPAPLTVKLANPKVAARYLA